MDKRMSFEQFIDNIESGSTVAIGGSALSRKPMALIRALGRSDVRDLRIIVDVGGPDVDLLIGTGSVSEVIYAFVGFEVLGLAPHFRKARQKQSHTFQEWTEYTVMAGLDATVKNVPFLPTRTGLATDVLKVNPSFKTFADPFSGDDLVAIPALNPDVAIIHANYADSQGNGILLGDSHIDVLAAKAAKKTFMSCESVMTHEELQSYGRDVSILRIHTDGVIEAPWGAHPTGCSPAYRADLPHLQAYLKHCKDDEAWQTYHNQYIAVGHEQYIDQQGGPTHLGDQLHL